MSMRVLIIGAIIVMIVLGVGWYFFFSGGAAPQGGGSIWENPFGESPGTVVPPGGTTQEVVVLETRSGATVSVPDFTKGKQSFPIESDIFYFITNNQQTQGADAAFDIVYGTDSSISIGLFKEPLAETRLSAEDALRALVPLPADTLCTLRVSVAVPHSINSFYSGRNLGLSFCPGAVTL